MWASARLRYNFWVRLAPTCVNLGTLLAAEANPAAIAESVLFFP
jgi:hypothetical protein